MFGQSNTGFPTPPYTSALERRCFPYKHLPPLFPLPDTDDSAPQAGDEGVVHDAGGALTGRRGERTNVDTSTRGPLRWSTGGRRVVFETLEEEVLRPGAPSSVLAPSSDARSP